MDGDSSCLWGSSDDVTGGGESITHKGEPWWTSGRGQGSMSEGRLPQADLICVSDVCLLVMAKSRQTLD